MHEFTYITAFIVGLMGGVHCVGMCGGIVGALSFAVNSSATQQRSRLLVLMLSYNLGRISSYTLAGGMMGAIGWLALAWIDLQYLQLILQLFAGVFMLLMGLYLSGWWMGLTRIEKLGAYLWRYLQPAAQKILPVSNPAQALLLGLLWGWLPCGLVYSVLIWSMSSGGFVEGALLMLSFGLGTLPNLLAMGLFANQLKRWVQKQGVRYFSGGLVMLFACWTLYLALNGLWHSLAG